MPEFKHTFTAGKMNKDVDERLVPDGQYRDAMNIQVSTSEGSHVGTAQNILGNREIRPDAAFVIGKTTNVPEYFTTFQIPIGTMTIATVSDEKNDTLYYLLWSPDANYIVSYTKGTPAPEPIFVDLNNVLEFDETTYITGINIIDDMMFWTDNKTEPKKINIPRCKRGTDAAWATHTNLINSSTESLATPNQGPIETKHITVIKKAPITPLGMVVQSTRDTSKRYTAVVEIGINDPNVENSFTGMSSGLYDFSSFSTEEGSNEFAIFITKALLPGEIEEDITGSNISHGSDGMTGWLDNSGVIAVNTPVAIKPYNTTGSAPGLPVTDYVIKGVIAQVWSNAVKIKITSIDGYAPGPLEGDTTRKYVIDLWQDEEKLFEFKFPRFSYRYKFEDGEYSPFGPFTQVAFLPGAFDYHPRKGYNLGMTNKAFKVLLRDVVTENIPKDIVSIDILFKDEVSPNIYVVDTIKPNDDVLPGFPYNMWEKLISGGTFDIEKETVNSVVPSNQLLRPWDNVPRKALAQDVTGNRIVYGNYLQNYDLKYLNDSEESVEFIANFEIMLAQFEPYEIVNGVKIYAYSKATKSIKSLREYQLGVVFTDKYGRETPVISNTTGVKRIEKTDAIKGNRISVALDNNSWPEDLTHFKFFIKETSGEYYNMAMDRWYNAEDGNIWLAFPSSDRNKIDIDTFLILKKGSDQDTLVTASARYKVIAIENEAPDFIKTSKTLISSKTHYETIGPDLFLDSDYLPFIGADEFKIAYSPYRSSPASALQDNDKGNLYIDFGKSGETEVSNRYKISSIQNNYDPLNPVPETPLATATYNIQLEENLGADVNFISDSPAGTNPSQIEDGAKVNIYRYEVENKPQFDGRFFVKIYSDDVFKQNIGLSYIEGLDFRTTISKRLFSMMNHDDHIERHITRPKSLLCEGSTNKVEMANLASEFLDSDNRANMAVSPALYPTGRFAAYKRKMKQYGYYAVPEFAAMSMYFKRYAMLTRRQPDNTADDDSYTAKSPAYLVKGAGGSLGNPTISYSNEDWRGGDHWRREVGASSDGEGYTAGFQTTFWWTGDVTKVSERKGNSSCWNNLKEDKAKETEVWFVDSGPAVAQRRGDNTLSWNYLSPTAGSGYGYGVNVVGPSTGIMDGGYYENDDLINTWSNVNYGNQSGITTYPTYWSMDLGFGGIIPDSTSLHAGGVPSGVVQQRVEWANLDNFFGIGVGNYLSVGDVNDNYNGSEYSSFVKSIYPSKQFRWKEDPNRNENIYTLSEHLSSFGVLRHSQNSSISIHTYDVNPGASTDITSNWWSGELNPATSMACHLSQNFSKTHRMHVITPAIAWNPETDGRIIGGLEITLPVIASDGSTSGAGVTATGLTIAEDLIIYVTSLLGTNTGGGGETAFIHKGMALWKYTKPGGSEDACDNQLSVAGIVGPLGFTLGAAVVDEFLVIRDIQENTDGSGDKYYGLVLGGYTRPLNNGGAHRMADENATHGAQIGTNYVFVQVGMNGFSDNSEFNINTMGREAGTCGAVGAVSYTLEFVEPIEPEEILSENPAVWETEPKDIKELDIYYEASAAIPVRLEKGLNSNIFEAIPIGSYVLGTGGGVYTVVGALLQNNVTPKLILSIPTGGAGVTPNNNIFCYRPDGLDINIHVGTNSLCDIDGDTAAATLTHLLVDVSPDLFNKEFHLPWHNCYSFKNGVESNRIRDNFNLPYISNGVKVSTTLEHEYKEEHRKYGLIYSGIYNSIGSVNNTNQFIAAEKITKDINPIYGSIQKLHSRDSDLVTLCEDKILKIQANKDALFNADGDTNVTASSNVLGQTIPFSGEYGISKNPESFASESYRAYFADKVRGTVLRLSKDGLTPISDAGMKDWFRDNLMLANKIIGSYDDRNNEYNITLRNSISNRESYPVKIIGTNPGQGETQG